MSVVAGCVPPSFGFVGELRDVGVGVEGELNAGEEVLGGGAKVVGCQGWALLEVFNKRQDVGLLLDAVLLRESGARIGVGGGSEGGRDEGVV